ncbi:MAG: hypothetical protein AVDCRST_MAG03-513 [uncultured Rubrobacteraceae bacterium]|uniref:Uncharacterized protein n=1 Tax=uncultured Rubrobacteraceae bacterium TaxID=349277 RepID=A0A6J4NKG5_9ACTN|nr:MAG: hypothetical protein AVDCRST_MAG03-513 [uncultured Rubrobacteraceae bacterium]
MKNLPPNFGCKGFQEVRRYEEQSITAREEGRGLVPALDVSF